MTDLLNGLAALLGAQHVLTDPGLTGRYMIDQRRQYHGSALAVVRPGNTEEVAAVMRLAALAGASVVPIAGNTSYCGGATVDETGTQIALSLERLNRIRDIDAAGWCMAMDAGVVLADAQAAAREAGLLLPLSLGSEGSCMVGGCVSTNAGGLTALRYGVTRDLVLGLEIVLPDGRILGQMLRLRKNNAGYDLRHLWIGTEGTLGIVTGVVMRLFPLPRQSTTAWIALRKGAALAPILRHLRVEAADLLTSFEILRPGALICAARLRGEALPVPVGAEGALLIELSTGSSMLDLEALAADVLAPLAEWPDIEELILTRSARQRNELWAIRETIPEAEVHCGGAVKHDISVPLSAVDRFLSEAEALVRAALPGAELSVYGHAGDGNIHFNVLSPQGTQLAEFSRRIAQGLSWQIYDLARDLGGTFSAEHGVGRLKRDLLKRYGEPTALDCMRRLRATLDPGAVCNPAAIV
jgi:FAD/FMN-containing dehydrogenase